MDISTETLPDEQLLLHKVASGDEPAFGILYARYSKKVYLYAFRILNSDVLAEEVMQETMLKLWLMEEGLNEIRNLDAWLKTVSRNKSLNILRRRNLESIAGELMGKEWRETHNETEEGIMLKDTRKVLEDGIALLTDNHRLVYQLCQQQGLKYEEAAARLNLSPLTVQTYMKHALRFLREYVSKHTDLAVLLILFRLR